MVLTLSLYLHPSTMSMRLIRYSYTC